MHTCIFLISWLNWEASPDKKINFWQCWFISIRFQYSEKGRCCSGRDCIRCFLPFLKISLRSVDSFSGVTVSDRHASSVSNEKHPDSLVTSCEFRNIVGWSSQCSGHESVSVIQLYAIWGKHLFYTSSKAMWLSNDVTILVHWVRDKKGNQLTHQQFLFSLLIRWQMLIYGQDHCAISQIDHLHMNTVHLLAQERLVRLIQRPFRIRNKIRNDLENFEINWDRFQEIK
jgi:hypothetical protein